MLSTLCLPTSARNEIIKQAASHAGEEKRFSWLGLWTQVASALCFLPSHGVNPTMAAFRPRSLLCNAVFRFLQATLETCSSSQFRASRFIALSLQTIRREITCNYNSSLANILNCQDSSILRMCRHSCDVLSAHTKHGGFGFIKFYKFTKSQNAIIFCFWHHYTIALQKVNAVRYQNID